MADLNWDSFGFPARSTAVHKCRTRKTLREKQQVAIRPAIGCENAARKATSADGIRAVFPLPLLQLLLVLQARRRKGEAMIGRWSILTGDCAELMATLESVDHVITDPPFEAEAHTKQRRKRGASVGIGDNRVAKIDSLSFEPLSFELREKCGAEFARLAKRWSIVFCQVEATQLWVHAMAALSYRRTGVWVKPDGMPQLTGDRPGMGYESIVFCHRKGRSRWNGGGRSSVFTHNKNSGGKHWHETQKPVPLMLELIELFTDPDDLILDPFCGSGTTGAAALRCGRRFLGIEKNPEMAQLARDRLAADASDSNLQAKRNGQEALFR